MGILEIGIGGRVRQAVVGGSLPDKYAIQARMSMEKPSQEQCFGGQISF